MPLYLDNVLKLAKTSLRMQANIIISYSITSTLSLMIQAGQNDGILKPGTAT